ncbi:hypothetical protein JHK82_014160 [Glycine max]|uniref:Uncharacterized protein n=2 Tax=Glycine subgen. Soja TaxID=1462606 RepID=A0A0R0JAR0_SOYBN|nr:hypothetical protein JHK87_014069 [Glycine soja]KAG5030552.1 hypothetical protein JHK85_014534 [Glycine max]KAG5044783.1 hypothetical protein JHK86_014189 [Glycine max]KAG5147279.1 hypothetical protein JHK82_014160 [Glycine max]KAH1123829.1 hypothetical protein GYH30_013860 [Glycine max]
MAEWSKAPDSSSGPRERAWVQIPLLTKLNFCNFDVLFSNIYRARNLLRPKSPRTF